MRCATRSVPLAVGWPTTRYRAARLGSSIRCRRVPIRRMAGWSVSLLSLTWGAGTGMASGTSMLACCHRLHGVLSSKGVTCGCKPVVHQPAVALRVRGTPGWGRAHATWRWRSVQIIQLHRNEVGRQFIRKRICSDTRHCLRSQGSKIHQSVAPCDLERTGFELEVRCERTLRRIPEEQGFFARPLDDVHAVNARR